MISRIADIQPHLIAPVMPLRDVMMKFGSSALAHAFLLVVDADRRLLGTVTDGDIRRAVLRGITLDAPISEVMRPDPKIGRWQADKENERLIRDVSSKLQFLPLIDEMGRVRSVLLNSGSTEPKIAALVMAGGFGKRLGELTRNKPKPLVEVAGQPILAHILDRLEQANVSRIFVSVHFLAEQIAEFVAARRGPIPIEVIREESPLGTAGALGLLPELPAMPVVMLNGDILTRLDFNHFIDFHFRHQYDATLAVAQHAVQIPFGVVRHTDDGLFVGVDEKPVLRNFVAAGLYVVSPEFRNLIQHGQQIDMPDLLNRGNRAGLRCGLFPIHEYWTDVGRPEDLIKAEDGGH